MKHLLILLSFAFIASIGWSQTNPNQWIHSYIKLKTHWDPGQISIEVRTCIRQETIPIWTAPGEGYYQTFVDPANVTYSLSIDGNVIPFNGAAIETNFNLGSTVPVTLLAQAAGYQDYQFDADILIDAVNPTITYNTIPNASVFNLPASLLRTTKGDTGGCDGELNLNISGGYPYSGTNAYAIYYDSPTNYHLDTLANLCADSTVAYKWGDDWWGCKGNFCDPNISSNCTPTTGFCNNDGFFCDEITIETRSCSLNDFSGGIICEGMITDFELVSVPGSNAYSYSYGGSGNFSDVMNPYHISTTTAYPQNYNATVTHLDGSVFSCNNPLIIEFGNPYLHLLSDSLTVCLGDTIIFEAGADWYSGSVTYGYQYYLYGNQYNSANNNNALDSIIIVTDSLGVFDLNLTEVSSTNGCIANGGISISFEVIDCDTLENPVAGINCLGANVICMDSCISFESNSLYGSNPSFEWDFGNGQTSTTEDPSELICYGESGYYTVSLTVTDDSGTDTYSYALQVVNCDPANLGDIENTGTDFKLYPNPTNSVFTISIENSMQNETYEVFIYDILGNRIKSRTFSPIDQKKVSFNLGNYSNGIYYVEVQNKENSTIKKVVLNK
jgi:PKD repeat protein